MNNTTTLSKYTHIIWDWNGTLQNDAWLCIDIINGLLSKRNKPSISLQQYRKIFGFPVKKYYELAGFDFSDEPFESLATEYILEYDNRSLECDLQPKAEDILTLCSEKNISQHLLSASQQKPLEINITHYGLAEYFSQVLGLSDYYAESKIENGRNLVAGFEDPMENIVLIGDTVHDYEVAQALGIDCILFSGGHQSKERLEICNTTIVENLYDLFPGVLS